MKRYRCLVIDKHHVINERDELSIGGIIHHIEIEHEIIRRVLDVQRGKQKLALEQNKVLLFDTP